MSAIAADIRVIAAPPRPAAARVSCETWLALRAVTEFCSIIDAIWLSEPAVSWSVPACLDATSADDWLAWATCSDVRQICSAVPDNSSITRTSGRLTDRATSTIDTIIARTIPPIVAASVHCVRTSTSRCASASISTTNKFSDGS